MHWTGQQQYAAAGCQMHRRSLAWVLLVAAVCCHACQRLTAAAGEAAAGKCMRPLFKLLMRSDAFAAADDAVVLAVDLWVSGTL
jgi:hypothetical protein